MPDASTQTEDTRKPRRPVGDTTQIKYNEAIKRLADAKLDLEDVDKVIDWIKTKGKSSKSSVPIGPSAQKVYYSAIKDKMGENFPTGYQKEIDRLYAEQNKKDDTQELSPAQKEKYVPYEELLEVQKRLAAKENKNEKEFKD